MNNKIKIIIKKNLILNKIAKSILNFLEILFFRGSKEYWEKRYATGGNSGRGSYKKFAEFKAQIINSFVENNKINSVIDFGCGDGNQISLLNFSNYIGLDISETAIKLCRDRFKADKTKKFIHINDFKRSYSNFHADLGLSLEVIFHLVEDDIFESYMKHLFESSDKFVIIYSSDTNNNPILLPPHFKNRKFSKWIEDNLPRWKLIKKIKNPYPRECVSDFFIYAKED